MHDLTVLLLNDISSVEMYSRENVLKVNYREWFFLEIILNDSLV